MVIGKDNLARKNMSQDNEPRPNLKVAEPAHVLNGGAPINEDAICAADPLDKLFHNRPMREHVKDLAGIFAFILFGVTAWFVYKRYSLADAGALFICGSIIVLIGYRAPRLILPVWRGWMGFAHVLEVTTSSIVLALMWVGLFIPIGMLLKVLGIKVMDMTFRQNKPSYWEDRDPKKSSFALLERQF